MQEGDSRNVLITTLISIGLAGCGSSSSSPNPTPTPLPTPTNHNPAITSSTVIPAFGISQITGFSAQAVATDSDGDAVTYEWDLGDGTKLTGAAVTHAYAGTAP